MKKLKQLAALLAALISTAFGAEEPQLIPQPRKFTAGNGAFDISKVKISADTEARHEIKALVEMLKENGISAFPGTSADAEIFLKMDEVENPFHLSGTYQVSISPRKIILKAADSAGFFNAVQTLRQLINRGSVPACEISDYPAFAVRGIMLDVGRYYMSVPMLKKIAVRMAEYKLNTLQLHLTDDPGWRFECKAFPQLTAPEAHWPTRLPGKFYTQQELRDLVEFCSHLNIDVIPEIDLPGHSAAFTKAMGYKMQTDQGLQALKKILSEVAAVFPDERLHIGSDETAITMPNFMPEILAHLKKLGKTPITWSPGYPVGNQGIAMCWGENEAGHRIEKNHRYIDCNGFYLDWMDSQSGVYQIFFQQPCEVPNGNENALGSILAVWCDGNLSSEQRVFEQYPFYPALLTFAERIWIGRDQKQRQLMAQLPDKNTPEWQGFAEFEQRLTTHRDRYFNDEPFAYVRQSQMQWSLIGPFNHNGQNDTSFAPEKKILPEYTDQGRKLRWQTPVSGGAVHIRHLWATFNMHYNRFRLDHWPTRMSPLVGKDPGTCYAMTYIKSPRKQKLHLLFGLNGMWGHSGGYRSARAPEQGSWDFSGGDIWLNDQRIEPPQWPFHSLPWTGWGRGRIEHAPLTQEGYFFRPPVPITLNKGWNKVLIRSVFGHWKGDNGQRKWFFCCIPVNWDGSHCREVDGLEYSPTPPGSDNW